MKSPITVKAYKTLAEAIKSIYDVQEVHSKRLDYCDFEDSHLVVDSDIKLSPSVSNYYLEEVADFMFNSVSYKILSSSGSSTQYSEELVADLVREDYDRSVNFVYYYKDTSSRLISHVLVGVGDHSLVDILGVDHLSKV